MTPSGPEWGDEAWGSPGIDTDRWVRIREAARIASVDPRTIRRWADTGRVRARLTPGGHRQVSVEGLGHAYKPARRSGRASRDPNEVAPDVAIPDWAASAALWRSWRPGGRLSDDSLAELRLDAESLRRSLADVEELVTDELRARDRKAVGELD